MVLPITAYAVIIASTSTSYRIGFAHMSSECRMFSLFNYALSQHVVLWSICSLTDIVLMSILRDISTQCRPRSDATGV